MYLKELILGVTFLPCNNTLGSDHLFQLYPFKLTVYKNNSTAVLDLVWQ